MTTTHTLKVMKMESKIFVTINNTFDSFVVEIVYESLEFRKEIYVTYKDELFDITSRTNNEHYAFIETGINKSRLMKLLSSDVERELVLQEYDKLILKNKKKMVMLQ